MAGNLDRKLRLPRTHFRILLHAANMRHGTNDFTSLPKEGLQRIFSPSKIRRLRQGLNPRTWVPKRPAPKPLNRVNIGHVTCDLVSLLGETPFGRSTPTYLLKTALSQSQGVHCLEWVVRLSAARARAPMYFFVFHLHKQSSSDNRVVLSSPRWNSRPCAHFQCNPFVPSAQRDSPSGYDRPCAVGLSDTLQKQQRHVSKILLTLR